ncbi:MAG: hypothetical protein NVSMB39_4300 [Candidatus Saccharimonadales bacterium]
MADSNDTLDIGSLRPKPAAGTGGHAYEPVKDEAAAAAARTRILAAEHSADTLELHDPAHPLVPAAPTASLITDKQMLAQQMRQEPVVRAPKIPLWLRPALTAVGVFFLVLLLFKIPVIISQAKYAAGSQATPGAAVSAAEVVPAENTITIPKINVRVPVNYEPSIQEAAIQKSLETGVVHYGNTAFPGQAGNVAIFGHSSNDWWEPGNFKFVFVLLDKLAPGDQVTVDYQSKRYIYEVTGSKVVEPTDVAVLNPTATPTLTIITCTPPGTSLKRLVVTAKQINPNPAGAVAAAPAAAPASGALPSGTASGGFFDQFGSMWSSLLSTFGLGGSISPAK